MSRTDKRGLMVDAGLGAGAVLVSIESFRSGLALPGIFGAIGAALCILVISLRLWVAASISRKEAEWGARR